MERFSANPTASNPDARDSWSETCATYRFLANAQIPLAAQNFRHDALAANFWYARLRQAIFSQQKSQHGQGQDFLRRIVDMIVLTHEHAQGVHEVRQTGTVHSQRQRQESIQG